MVDAPVLAASVALNVLSLLMPIALLVIFERVIPNQSSATLQVLFFALLACSIFEFILRWSRSILLTAAASKAAIDNQCRFLAKILSADPSAFRADADAVHMERFAALGRLRDHHSGQNQTLAIDLPFTFLFAVMIGLIGGWLVLVPLASLGAILIFSLVMKSAQRHLVARRKTLDSRRYAFLAEVLDKIHTVKINTMERQMTRRFEALQSQTVEISGRLIRFSGLAQSFGAIFAQLAIATMGLFGAYLVIEARIGVAELAACMLLNGRIIQPLSKLIGFWVQADVIAVAHENLAEIEKIKQRPGLTKPPTKLRGRVEFHNLSFSKPTGPMVYAPGVFVVQPGETALIDTSEDWVAQSLFSTIVALRKPDRGRVLIDGYLPVDRAMEIGANGLIMLEESPAILSGTLIENLSGFGGSDRMARAKVLARQLGLERRVHQLPSGYNTQMKGAGLFERDPVNLQLIAITRALALKPRLLLLNEPTSLLDRPERDALAACLRGLTPRPTILIASPDPRMQNLADTIVPLSSKANLLAEWEADAARETAAELRTRLGAA